MSGVITRKNRQPHSNRRRYRRGARGLTRRVSARLTRRGLTRRVGFFGGDYEVPIRPPGKKTTFEEIQRFITQLFDNIPVCFVSGAFVFSDDNDELYNFLNGTQKSRLFGPFQSHLSFKNKPSKNQSDKVDKFNLYETYYGNPLYTINCKTDNNDIDWTYIVKKCINSENSENSENADITRDVRIIKWYRFNGDDTKKYIYFKLEDYPTVSWDHIKQAYRTYVLKTPNESICKSFRENCKHSQELQGKPIEYGDNKCMTDTERIQVFDSKENGINIEYDINKEKYGRKGDEYYVDEGMKTKLLTDVVNAS